MARIGFIGLGSMGGPMAARLAAAGHAMVAFDAAGTRERAPLAARTAVSVADVARAADVVLLSLPDGAAVAVVTAEIAAADRRRVQTVVDTSTIGVGAARAAVGSLAACGVVYLDAPVSGGVAGARSGRLTMMMAGPSAAIERVRPLVSVLAANVFAVGPQPGQGQAMKLLNNVLSATALVATSEAIVFGLDHGLDMRTMLDVLNVSSGQNTATSDKFPRRVLTGTYDAGFATKLMAKDVRLYMEDVRAGGAAAPVGAVVDAQFAAADAALPGSDFTRIYAYVRGARRA